MNVVYHIDWFLDTCILFGYTFLHLWDKSHLIMVYDPFKVWLNLFTKILLRIYDFLRCLSLKFNHILSILHFYSPPPAYTFNAFRFIILNISYHSFWPAEFLLKVIWELYASSLVYNMLIFPCCVWQRISRKNELVCRQKRSRKKKKKYQKLGVTEIWNPF